jgi:osmotically-inducible protein OsmY
MGNFGAGQFGGGMSSYGERGRYSGKGPKGWQRSDDRIREDVSERLADHPHIDASEIEVNVNNGEITLSGTVEDRHAKRLAEDIAESVSGVRDVHNQIKVQHGQESQQGQRQFSNAGPVEQRHTTSTTTRNK